MLSKTLTVILGLFLNIVSGQAQETDKIGETTLHPIYHGSLALEWKGTMMYVDPYGAERFKHLPDPQLVFITDIHGDHLNVETLENLNLDQATIVCPQAVADKIPDQFKTNLKIINNGQTAEIQSIKIEAIPMYNLPESPDSRHTKGRGNGYILTIGDKRFYISGDTEDIPEMRALTDIDVAFVCMNLPYTMDVDQAARAVLEFKPGLVYPYHYRGGGGVLGDVEKFKSLVSENPNIEVRLRNWYRE